MVMRKPTLRFNALACVSTGHEIFSGGSLQKFRAGENAGCKLDCFSFHVVVIRYLYRGERIRVDQTSIAGSRVVLVDTDFASLNRHVAIGLDRNFSGTV